MREKIKKFLALVILYGIWAVLWFRYRLKVKGIDKLNPDILRKPGGYLFLPNHPAVFVDPSLIGIAIWKKFPIRPMIVEYMYYAPIVNQVMRLMNAIPVPDFDNTSNSLKKKRSDQVFTDVIDGLKKGDSFLIYPAGRTKSQAKEQITGSGVHRILQEAPETNVILVRTKGLWGSSFSRALLGRSPAMFPTIFQGIKHIFKNLLFFTPRREVTIEFTPAPADFPYNASRTELNRYLEHWYNKPDGLTNTTEAEPGDTLNLVSYSMWGEELPKVAADKTEDQIDLAKIPADIQKKVLLKISQMSQQPIDKINPEMNLGIDLGMDSLDSAELLAFLDDNWEISGVPVSELTTVGKLMAIAAKQITFKPEEEEERKDMASWKKPPKISEQAILPAGKTTIEVFLNNCERMGSSVACADMRSGILTYNQAKMRVLLLADYIRHLPGEYIGFLLPSSVPAYLTILACQLAGKTPLPINWTVGPRHLETVKSLTHVQVILSSWAFLDRLENVDLKGIEDEIVMFEDIRRKFTLTHKLKAFIRSKKSTKSILKLFNQEDKSGKEPAVLLFTSGTESTPKGVPLTHHNILSNIRASITAVSIQTTDVLLGALPPFHSFGFTVVGLLPLLAGVRVAFYPDPTDGQGLARSIERWGATLFCGTPTFLKNLFKCAKPDQLKTLRICVSGAEKAPDDLFDLAKEFKINTIIQGYGITECSPAIAVNSTGQPSKGVGLPIPTVELLIVDLEKHTPLPQGIQGLILTRGPSVFNGYLNPGLASPFINIDSKQWYNTGDLGYIDIEGHLIISGRLKRFIKIGGEMVSLTAIEDVIHQLLKPKVKADDEGPLLAVCAREEPGEKTRIFLFTRINTTLDEANQALKNAGFSNLVRFSKIEQISEIPLMGTGKINYRKLQENLPALNDLNFVQSITLVN